MELTKDLFVSDGRAPHLTLTLGSRDLTAHALLTALSTDERAQVHHALSTAAAVIVGLLGPAWTRHEPAAGTSSFGCGT
jgi:hypothetical protein